MNNIKCDATKKAAPHLHCTLAEDHVGNHQNGQVIWTNAEAYRP